MSNIKIYTVTILFALAFISSSNAQVIIPSTILSDSLKRDSLDQVVFVGTRSGGRTRLTTAVPVDVFNIPALQALAPQNDLNQLLQFASPSFNSNRQSSSDGTEHIDPASLRGLGPDQVLVLVNGKRRHTTSLVNNQGTIGNGSVGTDLNAIPSSAIERIEVLRDGAAAQYGSDAIAGVINIVLKQNTNKLFASIAGGQTSKGDGRLGQLNVNYGTALGKNGGYINFTAEAYDRGGTNRTQHHDLIIFDQSSLDNYFAYDFTADPAASRQYDDDQLAAKGLSRDDFNFRVGDAHIKNISGFFNLSAPFNDGKMEFYAFGGYNYRRGNGYGFKRLPSDYSVNVYSIFPNGYQPTTVSDINDRSVAAGLRFKAGEWNGDISNTFGDNRFDFGINNTVNASLEDASPTRFKAGGHEFIQNTTNLDFNRKFESIGKGLNVAFGSELRIDNYRIREGEEASWKNYALVTDGDGNVTNPSGLAGGSQSFPGFSPSNKINESRSNISVYADAELDATDKWLIGGAARFEHYTDFGSTLNGKLDTRYKITPFLNVRGAISTGFRAPSLHQQFFSYVSTNILPNGRLGQGGFFTNNSAVAKALDIPELKQESSVNYSIGFTARAAKNFNITIDAYQVNIKDRIVLSGSFGFDAFGDPVQEIQDILTPLGASSARFFSNAVDTRTRGIDLVADYTLKNSASSFNASFGVNVNKNSITAVHVPVELAGQEDIYFSPADSILITNGTPNVKANLSLTYQFRAFTILFRNVYFGDVSRYSYPFGEVQEHKGKVVTDLSLSYKNRSVTYTVGANNLFDVYPDEQVYGNSYFGVFKYAPIQQGFNGSFYFGKISIDID